MAFQLLQPNVAAVVPCCCNNMFMVFQLLQRNVAVVVPRCCTCFIPAFYIVRPGRGEPGGRGRVVRRGLAGGGTRADGRGCCGHGGAGHAACSSRAWGGRDRLWGRSEGVRTRTAQRLAGLFVGIASRGFVGVSGALRSTKTQQWQFAWARNLRAATTVHAAAPASYHRQWVRSLRASSGVCW